jgi:hypothetical protein
VAVILAYEVKGLIIVGGVEAMVKGQELEVLRLQGLL